MADRRFASPGLLSFAVVPKTVGVFERMRDGPKQRVRVFRSIPRDVGAFSIEVPRPGPHSGVRNQASASNQGRPKKRETNRDAGSGPQRDSQQVIRLLR